MKNDKISDNYQKAREHIKAAIEILGEVASSDELARDCIANLGVVALDLNK